MRFNLFSCILLAVCCLIMDDAAGSGSPDIVFETTQIDKHAYILTRNWDRHGKSRNNIGVVIGQQGIVLINVMYENGLEQLLAEVRKLSDKPIKYAINSNWDFHNTDANQALIDKGVTIISHNNLKYFNNTVTQLTFEHQIELDLGTETLLAYRSYGHSMGHINIYLNKANAIFMSDSYRDQWMTTPGPYGYRGYISALQSALKLSDADTKFIPGNTSSTTFTGWQAVRKEISIREAFAKQVLTLKSKGLSVDKISETPEIQALFRDNYERYPDYKGGIVHRVRTVLYGELVHNSMTSEDHVNYVGLYQLPNDKKVEVFSDGKYLHARSEGMFYFLLIPLGKDKFEFGWPFPDRSFEFVRASDNRVIGFKVNMKSSDEMYGQELYLKYLKTVSLAKRIK